MRKIKGAISLAAAMTFLLAVTAAAADAPKGKELVQANGCTNCHKIEGKGGNVGPDLSSIGSRLSEEQIRQKLVNPPPGMPSFKNLPKEKVDAMADYLASLK